MLVFENVLEWARGPRVFCLRRGWVLGFDMFCWFGERGMGRMEMMDGFHRCVCVCVCVVGTIPSHRIVSPLLFLFIISFYFSFLLYFMHSHPNQPPHALLASCSTIRNSLNMTQLA